MPTDLEALLETEGKSQSLLGEEPPNVRSESRKCLRIRCVAFPWAPLCLVWSLSVSRAPTTLGTFHEVVYCAVQLLKPAWLLRLLETLRLILH